MYLSYFDVQQVNFKLNERFKPKCINEPEYSGMKLGEDSAVKMVFKAKPRSNFGEWIIGSDTFVPISTTKDSNKIEWR